MKDYEKSSVGTRDFLTKRSRCTLLSITSHLITIYCDRVRRKDICDLVCNTSCLSRPHPFVLSPSLFPSSALKNRKALNILIRIYFVDISRLSVFGIVIAFKMSPRCVSGCNPVVGNPLDSRPQTTAAVQGIFIHLSQPTCFFIYEVIVPHDRLASFW